MYIVNSSEEFAKQSRKVLSNEEQRRLEELKKKLHKNPFIGRPLGFSFFRELRIGSKRAYYIISNLEIELKHVGHKNDQEKDIANLREVFDF